MDFHAGGAAPTPAINLCSARRVLPTMMRSWDSPPVRAWVPMRLSVLSARAEWAGRSTLVAVERVFKCAGDERITLARGRFQSVAIDDRDLPTAVTDQPGVLECETRRVDAWP